MTKKVNERGAVDDWESLHMIMLENPTLKQRVFHRLRALKKIAEEKQLNASRKAVNKDDGKKDKKEYDE